MANIADLAQELLTLALRYQAISTKLPCSRSPLGAFTSKHTRNPTIKKKLRLQFISHQNYWFNQIVTIFHIQQKLVALTQTQTTEHFFFSSNSAHCGDNKTNARLRDKREFCDSIHNRQQQHFVHSKNVRSTHRTHNACHAGNNCAHHESLCGCLGSWHPPIHPSRLVNWHQLVGREIDIFSFFFFAAHPNRCFDYIEEKAYRVGERREIKGQCKEIMCMSDYTLRTKSLVYIEWECLFGRATTESRSYRIVNFVCVFFLLVLCADARTCIGNVTRGWTTICHCRFLAAVRASWATDWTMRMHTLKRNVCCWTDCWAVCGSRQRAAWCDKRNLYLFVAAKNGLKILLGNKENERKKSPVLFVTYDGHRNEAPSTLVSLLQCSDLCVVWSDKALLSVCTAHGHRTEFKSLTNMIRDPNDTIICVALAAAWG